MKNRNIKFRKFLVNLINQLMSPSLRTGFKHKKLLPWRRTRTFSRIEELKKRSGSEFLSLVFGLIEKVWIHSLASLLIVYQ